MNFTISQITYNCIYSKSIISLTNIVCIYDGKSSDLICIRLVKEFIGIVITTLSLKEICQPYARVMRYILPLFVVWYWKLFAAFLHDA